MKLIFEKTSLAGLILKNRLWRSATWLGLASENGHITPEITKRYEELAHGGVGTIITGLANAMEEEKPYPGMLSIYSDDYISEYKKFTDMIHFYDTNIVMQIAYGGSTTSISAEGRIIWGPSAVENPSSGIVPQEMTKEDISKLINAMGQAALRAKKSGFDGVQIHAAHGYLFSQFLAPYFNIRTDEYGGDIKNRSRIIFEVLESIQDIAGEDFPVFIKMHCDDFWGDKGIDESDSLYVAKELEKRGVAGIEFSGGSIDPSSKGGGALKSKIMKTENQSYFKNTISRIASELNIPVISVGGNRNVNLMNDILNESNISYFSMSRTLHAEPDLPNKWKQNSSIKPRCVSCNNCWTPKGNVCILDRRAER